MTKASSPTKLFWLAISSLTCASLWVATLHSTTNAQAPPSTPAAAPQQIGTITDAQLNEISGLAPSHSLKGLWWAHNDSGDTARLFVLNSKGQKLGQFTVTGAENVDWEDLASYVDKNGKPWLLIADSGNNGGKKSQLTLYRVPEPNLKQSKNGATAQAETFTFRYPDGNHDAEALFVDPATGRPYLVTKTSKTLCGIYRFPWPLRADATMTLEPVKGRAVARVARLVMVTGASTAPNGLRLAIRTYFGALELTRPPGSNFEALFDSEPRELKIALERQGEAISYSADSKQLITTSERVPAPIFKLALSKAKTQTNVF